MGPTPLSDRRDLHKSPRQSLSSSVDGALDHTIEPTNEESMLFVVLLVDSRPKPLATRVEVHWGRVPSYGQPARESSGTLHTRECVRTQALDDVPQKG